MKMCFRVGLSCVEIKKVSYAGVDVSRVELRCNGISYKMCFRVGLSCVDIEIVS